jgi:HSP20 family protein
MTARFSDPFENLFRLQKELEARFASEWLGGTSSAAMGTSPPINVFQQGHDFVAVIELPGVNKKDLAVEAQNNVLRISGTKAVNYGDGVSLHRRERLAGSFDRTLTLPVRIDAERIKAEYRDGILALFIPRAESDKPRTIRIG